MSAVDIPGDDPVAIEAIAIRARSQGVVAIIEMSDSMKSAARCIAALRAEVARLEALLAGRAP